MKRLALVTVLTLLALPGSALAHAQSAFYARVVRSSAHALTVRVGGGRLVSFAPAQAVAGRPGIGGAVLAHAARVAPAASALNLQALDPGLIVHVTRAAGGVAVELPGPGDPAIAGERRAAGVLTDVQPDAFVLELANHVRLRLHGSRAALAGLRACAHARVTYHQDAGLLVADAVRVTAAAAPKRCGGRDATGTVTAVSSRSLTIRAGGRTLVFRASTDGFVPGDLVDVSYGRGMVARAVHYVEAKTAGTVAASGTGEFAVIDSVTGRVEKFVARPTEDVAAGDHVVVAYHRSGGRPVADVLYAARTS